jgi:hypothetical protein
MGKLTIKSPSGKVLKELEVSESSTVAQLKAAYAKACTCLCQYSLPPPPDILAL